MLERRQKWRKPFLHCSKRARLVVLTAGPDKELAMIDRISRRLAEDGVVSLAGQLTLRQLASLIDHACLFIGLTPFQCIWPPRFRRPAWHCLSHQKLTFWSPWQVKGT